MRLTSSGILENKGPSADKKKIIVFAIFFVGILTQVMMILLATHSPRLTGRPTVVAFWHSLQGEHPRGSPTGWRGSGSSEALEGLRLL